MYYIHVINKKELFLCAPARSVALPPPPPPCPAAITEYILAIDIRIAASARFHLR
jgi:hypothetical protein